MLKSGLPMQNLLKSKTLIKLRSSDTVESLGGRLCHRKVVNSECGVEDCHSPEHLPTQTSTQLALSHPELVSCITQLVTVKQLPMREG